MKGYSFTELAKLVEAAMPRAGGAFSGDVSAPKFLGPLQGNADTATAAGHAAKLSTARNITIGGTTKAFNGTENLSWSLAEIGAINASATVAAAHKWATPRALQIGNSSKAVDGSTNVAWSLAEIGAVNKAGDTMTGSLNFSDSGTTKRGIQGVSGTNDYWFVGGGATASNAGYMEISTGDDGDEPIYVRQYIGAPLTGTVARTLTLLDASGNSAFPGNVGADAFLGNASTASKLQTGRSIALGGDLSGSATFDGSANITITAIVADDSHAHIIANVDGLQKALDDKKAVAVLSGTIAHGGTIPLPSGFTEGQCKWLVSMNTDNPNSTEWDIDEGDAHVHYKQQVYTTGRVVTAQTYLGSNNSPPGWISSIANYIIIGVK